MDTPLARSAATLLFAAVALFPSMLSAAVTASRPPVAQAPSPALARYAHQLTFPANALSRSPDSQFAMHARGLDWLGPTGTVTFTVRKPKDYDGGRVRVTYFYQVMSDESGTLAFIVTPLTLNSGNSFETYGSFSTGTRAAPENLSTVLSSSVTLTPGNGWGDGNWWYLEAQRRGTGQGGFPGRLRLMSVSVEY
ncbi:MAG: hypothetical protein ACRC2H_04135 [Silanimonas sp.]